MQGSDRSAIHGPSAAVLAAAADSTRNQTAKLRLDDFERVQNVDAERLEMAPVGSQENELV